MIVGMLFKMLIVSYILPMYTNENVSEGGKDIMSLVINCANNMIHFA